MTKVKHPRSATCGGAVLLASTITVLVVLLLAEAPPAVAAFPGLNGKIAYDQTADIWLASPAGIDTFSTNLTNSPAVDFDSSMSPDGRTVAFTSNRGGGDFEIYTRGIYTGALRQITNNAVSDLDPAWSRDGSQLAYVSPTNAPGRLDTDIWIKNADGSGAASDVSSNSSEDDLAPSWSPVANEIAFHIFPSAKVAVKNLNTGSITTLAFGGTAEDIRPNWSPDGIRLVFEKRSDPSSDSEIWTMRASDGTERRQLTNNAFDDTYPAYSPDGALITFTRNPFGDFDLYTMSSTDGTSIDEIVVSQTLDNEFSPDWGKFVSPPAGCDIGGTFSSDSIVGTNSNENICTLGGNDDIEGLGGNDTTKGGPGRDTLTGNGGSDSLLGGDGRDTINSRDGRNGNDRLNGGPGRDRCIKDRREASIRSCP